MDERRELRIFGIVVLALLLLTRIPAAARYLSIDNVNLAFALEYFDPLNHQPQPPGYPFFVLAGKAGNFVLRSVESTFLLMSLLATGLSLVLTFVLGRRMFSLWSGKAAVLLLLVNPVFWHAGSDSPLRPFIALFSLLTAYCAWRCWNGEVQFALWSAVALGIGSGFRPEILPYLFPLWLVSVWVGTRSLKQIALGLAAISGIVLIWVGALAIAVGGISDLLKLMSEYLVAQSTDSPLVGAATRAWLRQLSRLAVWNGVAVVWWIWAVPLVLRAKQRQSLNAAPFVFTGVWIVPGLCLQAAVHVAAPGHTLFSIPALCLIGAYVLSTAAQQIALSDQTRGHIREVFFAAALVFSVMLFVNFFPMPDTSKSATRSPSLKNSIAFALNETSLLSLRSMDRVTFVTLRELREFARPDRPTLVVSMDIPAEEWFMNWRILRYYEPNQNIWALAHEGSGRSALLVRRFDSLKYLSGDPVPIPIPRGGRILWLTDRTSDFYRTLCATLPPTVHGEYVDYTDIAKKHGAFHRSGFSIHPSVTPNVERRPRRKGFNH